MTAVHCAAYNGQVEALQLLVKFDANLNAKDDWGRTAMHEAAINKLHGADVIHLLKKYNAFFEEKDNDGATPLILACEVGAKENAKVLIELGASTQARDTWNKTCLIHATDNNQPEMIEFLVTKHKVNIDHQDSFGRSALHVAVESRHNSCISKLIELGADVDLTDLSGFTAEEMAKDNDELEVVDLIRKCIKNREEIKEQPKEENEKEVVKKPEPEPKEPKNKVEKEDFKPKNDKVKKNIGIKERERKKNKQKIITSKEDTHAKRIVHNEDKWHDHMTTNKDEIVAANLPELLDLLVKYDFIVELLHPKVVNELLAKIDEAE